MRMNYEKGEVIQLPDSWKKTMHTEDVISWANDQKSLWVNVYRDKDSPKYRFEAINRLLAIKDGDEFLYPVKETGLFDSEAEAVEYAEGWMKEHPDYYPSFDELTDEIKKSPGILAKLKP
jgi:hypothetical protein